MTRAPMAWREMVTQVEDARHLIMAVIAMKIPSKARLMLIDAAEKLNEITHRSDGD